jgi:hypothetical protein
LFDINIEKALLTVGGIARRRKKEQKYLSTKKPIKKKNAIKTSTK